MKFLILLFAISLPILFTSKVNAQTPNPSLTYSQSKKIIYLGKDSDKNNSITLKANFKPDKCKLSRVVWELTGIKDKDWCVVEKYDDNGKPKCGGSINQKEIEILFKKVGNYSFTLTAIYTYGEDEEDEISIERENVITVTSYSLYEQLQGLAAVDKFVQLVKKADTYTIRPEYSEVPSPNIFLAKGYYGMYKEELHEKLGITDREELFDNTIEAVVTSMESDYNGLWHDKAHKTWLNDLQNYCWLNIILPNLEPEEGYYVPYSGSNEEEMQERYDISIEGCQIYASISKYPSSIKLLEAALRYNGKDKSTANSIWNTEIAKLSELSEDDFDNMTETDLSVLKYGSMLSALKLTEISESNSQACQMLNSLKKVFENDRTFNAFFKTKYNNCAEE